MNPRNFSCISCVSWFTFSNPWSVLRPSAFSAGKSSEPWKFLNRVAGAAAPEKTGWPGSGLNIKHSVSFSPHSPALLSRRRLGEGGWNSDQDQFFLAPKSRGFQQKFRGRRGRFPAQILRALCASARNLFCFSNPSGPKCRTPSIRR